ncbi:DUF883 family protein [Accumulibacter sp.]|jgi:ElaB/YqjD/DUF883 family membrane-anchored ribosome-binding protein|uniref:DUF883 family protein n=1 Tax=Accumulibacter sp. TaxID=2053492 RepID=UPI001AD47B81|nr:DUF883 family protein [Accumulibacter sp.]MBN8454397.1 DUF883 domain-containing protein [Accumulibacter sp.]
MTMDSEMIARPVAGENTRERLVKDIRSVVDDADQLLKEVADSSSQEISLARTRIRERLAEVRYRLGDARTVVAEKARGAADATHEYVADNPWQVLALAAAIGFLVGLFASRR